MKPIAMMKFGGVSAVFAMAQILLCASMQAQPSGIPGATYAEPLGIALEGWPYPYQVRFMPLEIHGQKLRMAFMDVPPSGAANGRTVVLLHGKNFDSSYWRGTIESLTAAGFRVVVPDQIGFNKSSKPDIEYSFDLLAANTARLLDMLDVRNVRAFDRRNAGSALCAHLRRPRQTVGARRPDRSRGLSPVHSAADDRNLV
jgi:pimeloyl-ACP methyl ester carboxylesterase